MQDINFIRIHGSEIAMQELLYNAKLLFLLENTLKLNFEAL